MKPLAIDPAVAVEQMRLTLFQAYDAGKKELVDVVFQCLEKSNEATMELVVELRKHLAWMAQTMHQAYHQDIPTTWETCPRDVCASTKHILDESAPTVVLRPSSDGNDPSPGVLPGA